MWEQMKCLVTDSMCEHLHPHQIWVWIFNIKVVKTQIYKPVKQEKQHLYIIIQLIQIKFKILCFRM